MLAIAQASSLAAADVSIAIAVHVHGVRSDAGELVVVLYGDNPDDFLRKGRRLARERVPARSGSVTVRLAAPRAGTYAVAVYHDENNNRKLDTSLIGLPTEGFGLSNNPVVRFRTPRLADAAFPVGDGRAAVDIALKY
jgi:uncharacterized protein (DUF2141 family)